MDKRFNIAKQFKASYFWDVDINSLDIDKSKRLIIERVFVMGTVKEISLVINYYGEEEVVRVLKSINYIDPKTLNLVSRLFNEPLKSFKCYTRKQLKPQPWNS